MKASQLCGCACMHGCYVASDAASKAGCWCLLSLATWTYLHGYALQSLSTLAVLSGREGLDPRVHACWRPYLGWRWWRCPLLDLLCNSRTCRVKTHAPRLIHLMRTQKCCRCASVDCRVSLIHYNKLKFGYKILRCPCVYKTICHIEKIRKQPHISLASEFGQ